MPPATKSSMGSLAVKGQMTGSKSSTKSPQSAISDTSKPPKPTSLSKSKSASKKSQNDSQDSISNEKAKQLKDTINQLQKELTEQKTLNQTYVYQIGETDKRHRKELENLKEDLINQRRATKEMEKKVNRVNEIEDAIIKLYLEMKDRSTEVVRERYDQLRMIEDSQEKAELKKENPLVVLDKLKANLRNLIAFKEDYENELKDQINRKMTEAEKKLQEVKKRCKELEDEKEEYKLNAARAIQEKNEALESKRETIDESNMRMRRLQKDNSRLIDEVKKSEQIISELNQKLDNRDKILRHREIQLMRITQLESQIQKTKLKHQFDQNKIKSEMFKSSKSFERQLSHFNKIKAEKKDLEDALQKMAAKVQSLMKDTNRTRLQELEKKSQQQQGHVDKMSQQCTDLSSENKKLKMQMENLKKENASMKSEYEKIFMAALREKKRKSAEREKAIKDEIELHSHENAQKSPHITEYYKKRLKEKEKEVEDLTKRVRRMILSEHRGNITEKNFELERTRLQSELSTLKKMYAPKDGSQFRHQFSKQSVGELQLRNRELEEKLRDYENLKAANMTQTAAYNRLQQRQQSVIDQMMDNQKDDSDNESEDHESTPAARPQSAGWMPSSARPQSSSYSTLRSTSRPQSAISGISRTSSRPQSAGPTRPRSASGKKIRLGATYSSVKVGSLLS